MLGSALRHQTRWSCAIRGILKLFFASAMESAQVVALAQQQVAAHQKRLAEFEALTGDIQAHAGNLLHVGYALATLRMGILYERTAVEFWWEIAAGPPRLRERDS